MTSLLRKATPMNSASPVSSNSPQRLRPISLFVNLAGNRTSGRLQVTSGPMSWFVYLEQGQLAFATNSRINFDRITYHLEQLAGKIPSGLVRHLKEPMRQIYESAITNDSAPGSAYKVLHWLVEQRYLNRAQATAVVEALAKEAIESLLRVTEGSYVVMDKAEIEGFPNLCQLDLRYIVAHCEGQLRRKTATPTSGPLTPPAQELKQAPPQPAQPNSTSSPPTGAAASTTHTIACIDDSPTMLQTINSFLSEANCSVVMINDPLKALMQVIRTKPDLVLLDVGMPNLDGYELCSLMRRHSNFKTTPIIMVTGNTGFIDRAKAKLVGASGYLTKPFTKVDLLKMVFKHLA